MNNQEGNIVHIVPVGTSLINNTGMSRSSKKVVREPDKDINIIKELNEICFTIVNKAKSGEEINNAIINNFLKKLNCLEIEKEVKLIFSKGDKPEPANRFSQEITYIFKRYQKIKKNRTHKIEKEKVYFLPTDTIQSKFCADIAQRYINNHAVLKKYFLGQNPIPLVGISRDNVDIPQQGINNLHKNLYTIIKKAEKVYINITGGIKSLVAYFVLQGMLHSSKCIICYLQQDGGIIEIPVYPLGIDFHHYHRNAKRLKMVLDGYESYNKNLSKQMRNLIDSNGLTILGKQFKQRYEEQLKIAPIEVYSKEIVRILLPDDLDKQAKSYREILEKVLDKSGAYIWTGDKIPEMVEHARRHHHNLLEFAEMFLTPILQVNENFLNEKERFCLIAGILLHDCGHSIDFIKTAKDGAIPLFQSEIREFHHILSVQRLNDRKLAKDIGWISRKAFRIQGVIYDAVMDVCRYHRKRMPYTSHKNFSNALAGEYKPLKNAIAKYRKIDIDIMKIVALVRIIDSCDNQSSRPGTNEEVKIARNLLKKDYETSKIRAVNAYEAYEQVCKMVEGRNGLKKGCNYVEKSKKPLNLKKNYMTFRVKCLDAIKNKKGDVTSKTLARAWLTAADLIDRADMKQKQDRHYKENLYIREVRVIPSINKNKFFKFNIILCPVNKSVPKLEKISIMEKLLSEYRAVKDYLKRCKIHLKYDWKKES